MNGDDTADEIMTKFLAHFEEGGVVDGKVRIRKKKISTIICFA